MRDFIDLFVSFFKVGLFTFGGGYAMLPMLQREVVDKHHWVTEEDVLDIYAIAQCTPGVIAVNTATFVGYRRKGVAGGFVATFGVVLPSLTIICILAGILQQASHIPAVVNAFAGIRAAVAALVVATLWKLYRKGVRGAFANGIFLAALALAILGVNPVWVVLVAVVLGVILEWGRKRT